ncbi:hypothetical protein SKAU_G00350450 [Synaphobranchus kaupii]|uniref:Uncharacterized protein n=1 Tax=Synaphobranchus kaupii TaxID=118154 RepID=A0A9Q1IHW4_SYNKA|nr:hypothetical protein SKAU_G00350450 [Synaphobranchus kaupii]
MHSKILPGIALDPWEQSQDWGSQASATEEACAQTLFLEENNFGVYSCPSMLSISASHWTSTLVQRG